MKTGAFRLVLAESAGTARTFERRCHSDIRPFVVIPLTTAFDA